MDAAHIASDGNLGRPADRQLLTARIDRRKHQGLELILLAIMVLPLCTDHRVAIAIAFANRVRALKQVVGCELLFKPPLVVEISRDSEISSGSHRGEPLAGLRCQNSGRVLVP